ncbi:helix-turn-helix domain-containing protein [Hymenobacter chitinivorans]|uniref:Helix-turn-helix protein n=1 Tax=Hymenobacter chitinivorans DSM 11115 TaxID=1121954 RepID=A0A2M9BSS8_9BACT|nr:helix-turn-helix transcriptional regulator [Hymenobacter chitinivorans]PJJ61004.1 helix-turn-helix protein [Hymenobacter chitinivorans DSM 11115]
MPRRASTSLPARVRAWLGLTQTDLALYLGVSQSLLQAIEAGQRPLTHPVRVALLPLLLRLPPPEVPAAPATDAPLPPATPAPDAADLDFRRRECLHRAAGLLAQAEVLAGRAHVAARWEAALPALLPPDPGAPPADPAEPVTPAAQALAAALEQAADPTDPQRALDHARWLRSWLHHRARPLTVAETTRLHRLRAQAAGLLAEAEALATIL